MASERSALMHALLLCGLVMLGAGADAADIRAVKPIAPVRSPPDNATPSGAPVRMPLVDAVALGLRENRNIRSAYLERVAQKYDLFVSETRFLPRINLAADLVHERGSGYRNTFSEVAPSLGWTMPTGAQLGFSWIRRDRLGGGESNESIGLSLSQPLLRGGGIDVNMAPVRLARLQDEISRLALKTNVADTITAIILAYRGLYQAQEQVRISELALERMRDLLETNRALIDAGRMAAADIVQTEANLAGQEVALFQARQARTSAQLVLLRLLAADPRTNIVADDAMAVRRVSIDQDKVLMLALSSRMDVLAQRLAVEQNRQALLVARNNLLPDLSVAASMSRQNLRDPLLGRERTYNARSVGIQLDIPIGDFSVRQGEVRAETGLRTAELRYDDLLQTVEAQIRDAVQRVEAAWLQVEAANRARDLAERALDIQRERLAVGRASNFEVLSFQTDLRAADMQALAASIAYQNELTSLDQQIGSTLDTWRISLND